MKNPREILPMGYGMAADQQPSDSLIIGFHIPTYQVTDEGIIDGQGTSVKFCKGDSKDATKFRQEGVFTETLIETAKQYLESVNKGELATRETSIVITKLEEALMWLNKRAEDRKRRGVQGTYQK